MTLCIEYYNNGQFEVQINDDEGRNKVVTLSMECWMFLECKFYFRFLDILNDLFDINVYSQSIVSTSFILKLARLACW